MLLLGACQMTAFLESFSEGPAPDDAATAAELARAAVRGLLPRGS
jgi:hypothetical protein